MLISGNTISPYLIGNLFFFDVVCRHLSFSSAAEELNVSQAAVSQRIRQLEEQLGLPLFHRHARGVTLTKAGASLHNGTTDGFGAISSAVSKLAASQTRNDLVVSCPPSLAMDWLIPRLDDFYATHPDIKLKILAEYKAPSREDFQHGGIDVALRYEPPVLHQGLTAENIAEEQIVPVCTPAFKQKLQPRKDLAKALAKVPLLHDGEAWDGAPNDYEWATWLRQNHIRDFACPYEKFFNLAQLAVKAALQGQGVAIGRATIILDYLIKGDLIMLDKAPVASGLWYRFITPESAEETEQVAKFKSWFRENTQSSSEVLKQFLQTGAPAP
ncbi:LysR family transcriptional regulator [Kordiimonas marina]|uniref:LysR family transcriptional regulator n=1 Tax=Kordiimonas marina TaxID=2872312 RepID=UPI001FF11901|nr:LysR family transcriptional regulator [Kordiimonas marina]MCJ9427987.1 LysR family transcriptional regulator [Kordiimonas marina]